MTTEAAEVNFLKSKKVIVKGIYKEGKWATLLVNDIKDSNLFPGTKHAFSLPWDRNTNALVQIFDNTTRYKTPQYDDPITEQEFFERQLGIDKGGMNFYSKNSFWKTDPRSRVIVPKEGITLDLSTPMGYVQYCILKANKNTIAPSWKDRFKNPEYRFVIDDDDAYTDDRAEEMKLALKVSELFATVTSSKESMVDFLKVKGEVVPKTIREEKLKVDIYEFSKNKPKDFIRIADDPNFDEKVFLADAIRSGSIVKTTNKEYELNGVIIAGNEKEMITWLVNPENSAAKMKIKYQIENAK